MMGVSVASPTVNPLALVSDVALRLASGDDVIAATADVLEHAREVTGATEVSLWLHGFTGLACSVRAGAAETTAEEVQTLLDADGGMKGSLSVRRLVSGARRLGGMAIRTATPLGADALLAIDTIANILAPELSRAEQLRLLEVEIDARTRQLEDERRFTDKIIDSLPLGLYVIDRDFRVQAWNRKRETGMQGVSREHALGRTIFDILHRAPAGKLREEFEDIFRDGRMQQFDIESDATGEARTYRISKIPMRLGDAAVTHVITIGEDVTDWTTAQARAAQSEKLAAIGQLAAGVMHEVNNPLATIAACAESLVLRLDDLREAGSVIPVQATEYLRIIDNEVHRCKRIVDGLLDFSRPKSLHKTPTDVNAAVEQAVFLIRHHARFRRLQLQTFLEPGLVLVDGNAEQLIQVVMAFLINAGDAMSDLGTIAIRTRGGLTEHEAVIIEVIDEGKGIARADLPKIFEPFFTTKPPGRGTGLGLSVCYGIIADHHGRIEVDSAHGTGSTFRIVLPGVTST